mmetsp:Transcript_134088/g.244149  ORF Transcript_134088/g.244149 Transcript_134088/m.244149 type:complete len:118 (+) Transcript_134088:3105-3458(+)
MRQTGTRVPMDLAAGELQGRRRATNHSKRSLVVRGLSVRRRARSGTAMVCPWRSDPPAAAAGGQHVSPVQQLQKAGRDHADLVVTGELRRRSSAQIPPRGRCRTQHSAARHNERLKT